MEFIDNLLLLINNFSFAVEYTCSKYPLFMLFLYICFASCIGSFVACAVYRIPRGISLINPKNSFCPHCKNKLRFFDLIPIFSYIFLCGKCKYCKKAISPKYFLIEIATLLVFLLILCL